MGDKNKAETKELLDFVFTLNKKSLSPLVVELSDEPSPLAVYVARTKEDWKELYRPAGIDVYHHLHPAQGIII